MESNQEQDGLFEKVDEQKRSFLKHLAIGSAFAIPVMQSFSMDGLKVKSAHAIRYDPTCSPHR